MLSKVAPGVKTQFPKTIICLSSTHWHFLWQRPQQIMSRLSREYNVLFVDPPYALPMVEILAEKTRDPKNAKRLMAVSQTLKVLSPYQIAAQNTAAEAENNLNLIREQTCQALLNLNWNSPKLLWVYNPAAVQLVERLGEAGVIYDCVDSFSSFSWSDPHTGEWEAQLVRKADLVLTSAGKLYQQWRSNGKPVYLIPNAADYEHFSKCAGSNTFEPADLKAIKRPRLGFVGALYEWLDFQLLQWLAEHNPYWNLVLIGPRQHGLEVPELGRNIHCLGPRDYKILPWYLNCIDVMLIPFLRNQTTEHANPIKFWEYLAAGKPVVATMLPEIIPVFGVTWLCDSYQQFNDHCHRALETVHNPLRQNQLMVRARQIAKHNSWEKRCQEITAILREHFN